MALYKETGTNPFASCLPILLQMPIFLALFRLIDHAAKRRRPRAADPELAHQFAERDDLRRQDLRHASPRPTATVNVQILAAVLVVAMTATTFLTQRQLMSKNMPADAMTGQYAQQQKMLLYVLPVVFAVGGIAFPIGVLFYWTTSNLWTMCQQFYVIRNNPAPGTPAAKAKQERDAAKRAAQGPARPGDRRSSRPRAETAPDRRRRGSSRRSRPAASAGRQPPAGAGTRPAASPARPAGRPAGRPTASEPGRNSA